ncbi:MAG: DedA family protein [Deltaproteobacteria bacterium]|nr:DedA family protein [Deltaproteobacteria bacterium]
MELIRQALDLFFHLDTHLDAWMNLYGLWIYAILFTIVFCETGLVVTPFLPGDSLLFTAGALAARPTSPLELHWLILLLCVAAIVGDAVNFAAGYRIGPKVFHRDDSIFLNKKHLWRAQRFYEHHGGKTIVLARFIPIIRTFAPFVAGIGKMTYPRFAMFNFGGGIAWVVSFTAAGYFFGNMPYIKRNFHYVIVAIIVISVIPAVVEYFRHRNSPEFEPPKEPAA